MMDTICARCEAMRRKLTESARRRIEDLERRYREARERRLHKRKPPEDSSQ